MSERVRFFALVLVLGETVGGCGASSRAPEGDGDADADADVDADSDADADTDADADADTDADCGEILASDCGDPAPDESLDVWCEDVAPCQVDADCVVLYVDPCCGTRRTAVRADRQDEVLARLGECDADPPACPDCIGPPLHAECVLGTCTLLVGDPIDCDCPVSENHPVCGVDGVTYDAACGLACVPVAVACEGQCPCPDAVGCGGWLGATCTADEFCDYQGDGCDWADASGVCRPRPGGCPDGGEAVCGCDGQTYLSLCEAQDAGVDAAASGPCG